jgi:hypothetical protein
MFVYIHSKMGRPNYVCTIRSQDFTRKFSGIRHNSNIHNGRAEIVRFVEYMAGRNSGKYHASHPSWYNRRSSFRNQPGLENLTIADDTSTFRYQNLQQPSPLPYGSATTEQKLDEFRVLLEKHTSPTAGYKAFIWAKSQLSQGDDTYLNDALNNLRMRDKLQGRRPI